MEHGHNNLDKEMNVTEHLGELRKRLIITISVFILFFIGGFIFIEEIFQFFKLGFEQRLQELDNQNTTLTVLGPFDILWVYLTLASVIAIAGTLPVLCLQVWLFIKPALTPKEQKVSLAYIPAIFLLFIGGLCFGYFMIQPLIFNFLVSLGDNMFTMMFTADKYFKFLLRITLPFAIFFEIPIIMMFLTSLGIVQPGLLRKVRKYAYFVLIIIGTMISPPDFILQIVVAIPLIVLYEVSIILSGIVARKQARKTEEFTTES
ncbi:MULTISPECIES: twin-arginine translocase subunit TatC [Pontibacillus]|uniref:Sec-independent protein translocase protein TatC n=1 Tax=Pontibacillus chungwhensis TaxID=265426 RepID=A0ABY8URM0_9BACI|nr:MULTISPECIES: twin-arginine translocase subunit TatC [Pontibacillus]MCD5322922.1 twin-arginine translocase subunit TatC [Pontibacillus sp. HN14]WIF96317.1 twin-arginine translocase subunit TatC [Pontibacillus chungwhensis]